MVIDTLNGNCYARSLVAVPQRWGGVVRSRVTDQKYWKTRAETMRLLAEDVRDADARTSLLKAAESYQRLADQAERCNGRSSD